MSEETTIEATPEVVTKKKPGRKPKEATAGGPKVDNETLELLMAKFSEMMQQQREGTLELAEALRKPTELEQKKLDEERVQRIKRQAMSVAAAKQKEASELALQALCRSEGHANPNGGTRFRAQVNSDGYFVPVCMKCHIQLPRVKATAEEIQNGVMLGNYKGLTEDALRQLARYRNQSTQVA